VVEHFNVDGLCTAILYIMTHELTPSWLSTVLSTTVTTELKISSTREINCKATNLKAETLPDEVDFFKSPNPSDHTRPRGSLSHYQK
jgi:hypothetical protein